MEITTDELMCIIELLQLQITKIEADIIAKPKDIFFKRQYEEVYPFIDSLMNRLWDTMNEKEPERLCLTYLN